MAEDTGQTMGHPDKSGHLGAAGLARWAVLTAEASERGLELVYPALTSAVSQKGLSIRPQRAGKHGMEDTLIMHTNYL